jgi:hypothetical protein
VQADKKFFQWLRSGLRKLSQRWPPAYEAMNNAKVPYVGDNKRKKWLYRCAKCAGLFDSKSVASDHIIPCGSLSCKEDIAGFIERLFVDVDGYQILCDGCHNVKTYMDKYGVTEEQAKEALFIAKMLKKDNKQELQQLLDSHDFVCKNNEQRKEALKKIYQTTERT